MFAFTLVVLGIALLVVVALYDNGTVVREYRCPRCNYRPPTYVTQTSPDCFNCGGIMEEHVEK